jgi:ferric hydroxamate transport system substrate-binding protein
MKRRSVASLLVPAGLALLVTACGTTDESGDARDAEVRDVTSAECAGVTTSSGPVTVTDSFGRQVTLDQPARRVAVLEWQQVEDVLSLCVVPVGVADIEGYGLWNTAETLPEGVTDLGGRAEPNLDALYATNPDLVIAEATSATDEIITTLEQRDVPVLAIKGADVADPVKNMLDTFSLIGETLGRTERATQVTGEFEVHLAEAKQKITATGTTEFVYFDGWIQGGNVSLRPFGQGSLVGELGEALGLTNAWTGEVDEAYGLGQTDIEGMTAVGSANLFYTGTEDPDADVIGELEKNPIWQSLPAVSEGRARAFPPGIWTFGGPRSSQQVIDAYVDLLTS